MANSSPTTAAKEASVLNEENYKRVTEILKDATGLYGKSLNDWETDFIASTASRIAAFKEGTLFTKKQLDVMWKIEKKMYDDDHPGDHFTVRDIDF